LSIIEWYNNNTGFIEAIGIGLPIAMSFLILLFKGFFKYISGKAKNEFINSQTNLLERNIKLKEKMKKDLRRDDPRAYNPKTAENDLPDHAKFIDPKWYILNIEDKTIFALNEENSAIPDSLHIISPVDFYNNGLVVQFGFFDNVKIDKYENFFFPKNHVKEYKGFNNLDIRSFAYIPFEHIVNYEQYNEHQGGHPILYCKYSGIKSALETPFEKVEYKKNIQNKKWYFLPKLNNDLLFKDSFLGWTRYKVRRFLCKKI
jgi:hypothetical protein